jgi:hypothetical protein
MIKMTSESYETLEQELAAFDSMTAKTINEIYGVNENQALQYILNKWRPTMTHSEFLSALDYRNE